MVITVQGKMYGTGLTKEIIQKYYGGSFAGFFIAELMRDKDEMPLEEIILPGLTDYGFLVITFGDTHWVSDVVVKGHFKRLKLEWDFRRGKKIEGIQRIRNASELKKIH